MNSVLILNHGGTIIYDTAQQSAEHLGDKREIQFLPLLLTKDMMKANFHDRVNYVECGRKTVAFWEKHDLLYIAQAERGLVPPDYLQHCLATIHRFLRFTHGAQWQENFKQRAKSKLSSAAISNTLSLLPLISETTLPLYSPDMLGCVEQVELHEDLKNRLSEALRDSCDRAFLTTTSSTRFVSLFTPPRRTSSPLKRSILGKALLGLESSSQYQHQQQHDPRWSFAFLFANDKLVAQCPNTDDVLHENDNMAPETLFFIKCLILELLKRNKNSTETQADAQPSNESSRKSISISSLTPSSSDTSQQSSLSYAPDSSSSSAPYKISEKSASSVTLSPSNYSPPSLSWASSRQGSNNLSTRLSRFGVEHPLRSEIKPKRLSALLSFDDDRPFINLSSTPPHQQQQTTTERRRSSADSSPGSRSRSHSLSEKVSVKQSLKNMMGALMLESEPFTLDTSMLTSVKRWVKFGERLDPCTILLAQATEGLYSAVIFNDRYGAEPSLLGETRNSTGRAFKAYLAEALSDFAAFLLTKASTHFTILSFATTYPGLVHFLHINNGLLMTPTILDLPECAQNHGLLLELGEKYSEWVGGTFDNVAWSWPSTKRLHEVSQEMIRAASPFANKIPRSPYIVQCAGLESKGFRCVSSRTQDNQVLVAAYFSFVPDDIMLDMHDKLFRDIMQRQRLD